MSFLERKNRLEFPGSNSAPPLPSGRCLTMADIDGFYGVSASITSRSEGDAYNHAAAIVRRIWEWVIRGDVISNDKEQFYRGFDNHGGRGHAQKAPGIIARDFPDIPTFSGEDSRA